MFSNVRLVMPIVKHYKGLKLQQNRAKLIVKLDLYYPNYTEISSNRYEDVGNVMSLLVQYFSHYDHQSVSILNLVFSQLNYVYLLHINYRK